MVIFLIFNKSRCQFTVIGQQVGEGDGLIVRLVQTSLFFYNAASTFERNS